MTEPRPYREAFPEGSAVRVADRIFLDEFMATWKYHHKLQPEQLECADQVAKVQRVGY